MVGVDWCDAYAFCAWAGKRPCGHIGGGPVAPADRNDPAKSEWYAACSANGANKLPYGATYDAKTCNGLGSRDAGQGTDAVKSHPLCEGPPGVFDMSGNVYEWENSCDSDAAGAQCQLRGGDSSEPELTLLCAAAGSQPRNSNQRWGIRCCSN